MPTNRTPAKFHWARGRKIKKSFPSGVPPFALSTRALAVIQTGRIDRAVVYKVDRLSRSLLDSARLTALFDCHEVSFASITQLFNTTGSIGRPILNILLSFAQFDRELISGCTRDKMSAAGARAIRRYSIIFILNSELIQIISCRSCDGTTKYVALHRIHDTFRAVPELSVRV